VKMSQWADAWMAYYTGGKGNYTMAAMEDTGTLSSLQCLAHAGRVDWNRVIVLRTASNYDQPPSGVSAANELARDARGEWPGYLPALESAWRAGSRLVQEITMHWSKYKDAVMLSRMDAQ
jgi:purine nucleoside permease